MWITNGIYSIYRHADTHLGVLVVVVVVVVIAV